MDRVVETLDARIREREGVNLIVGRAVDHRATHFSHWVEARRE
jgi:hypothetical protein